MASTTNDVLVFGVIEFCIVCLFLCITDLLICNTLSNKDNVLAMAGFP